MTPVVGRRRSKRPNRIRLLALVPALFFACAGPTYAGNHRPPQQKPQPQTIQQMRKSPVDYVNPFIGTQHMGHTFPGACVPFGAVQLSPDTDTLPHSINGIYQSRAYEYCAGYQYDDPTIVGFSHTHLNGTGHSDLGDILLMPTQVTSQPLLHPGTAPGVGQTNNTNPPTPQKGYRSRYLHEREEASPGNYSVYLEDPRVKVQLTATPRGGMHRYTYYTPGGETARQGRVVLDLNHGIYNYEGKVLWSQVRVEDAYTLTGYRITQGWARTNYTYFTLTFSRPITNYGCRIVQESPYKGFWRKFDVTQNFPEMGGQGVVAYFDFDLFKEEGRAFSNDGVLEIQIALSAVDALGAIKNWEAELRGKNFETVSWEARQMWEKELSVVTLEEPMGNQVLEDRKTSFYTAMYHAMINPSIYHDVDGRYRGIDHNIHHSTTHQNYTVFSTWDTFRALHPLMNLLKPERSRQFVASMLAHYDQSAHGMLPVWSHQGNENWCMIGYHSVSVLADAYVKDLLPESLAPRLCDAAVQTATTPYYNGLEEYLRLGYVPLDRSSSAASETLEYAYDDWCVYLLSALAGDTKNQREFAQRAVSYRNVYDSLLRWVRPKDQAGVPLTPFDVLDTHNQGFIEGNSWNYSFFVPHNVQDLIHLMGGRRVFERRLDSLFTMELPSRYYEQTEDITRDGLMGNYVHGNEPSHHIPYLYTWTDSPWKGQERIKAILDALYRNAPNGLCGNDDCGQMSAWYIFSAMGFYPVCPGTNQYVLGVPYFKQMTLHLEHGKKWVIKAPQLNEKNKYVKEVLLNGKKFPRAYLTHQEITQGGELEFVMSAHPAHSRTFKGDLLPYSFTKK